MSSCYKISSFHELIFERGNIRDLFSLYKFTFVGKLEHDELQCLVDFFVDQINAPEFSFSEFEKFLLWHPEESAKAFGTGEEDKEAIINNIKKRKKRPLYEFLREELLLDWFHWQNNACQEIVSAIDTYLEARRI